MSGRLHPEHLRLGKSVNGSTLWLTTALWRKLAGSVSVFNPPVPLVWVKWTRSILMERKEKKGKPPGWPSSLGHGTSSCVPSQRTSSFLSSWKGCDRPPMIFCTLFQPLGLKTSCPSWVHGDRYEEEWNSSFWQVLSLLLPRIADTSWSIFWVNPLVWVRLEPPPAGQRDRQAHCPIF